MNTQYISPTIRHIGVDDLSIDLFENQYPVPQGISYNSYLLIGDNDAVAIIDTVDRRYLDVWFKNLEANLEGRTPHYLIIEHLEPDHSAGIAAICKRYPSLRLVATARAGQMLPQFFDDATLSSRLLTVGEGDTLSLGSMTLRFIMAPMVHWPEVMTVYEENQQILFSADAFGTFGALSHTPENITPALWAPEARRYYTNICGKYGAPVQTLLKKVAPLPISTICPLHGPVLRADLNEYIALYDAWSQCRPESHTILIAHASIHGHTAEAATYLYNQLLEDGASKDNVVLLDLCRTPVSEAVSQAYRAEQLELAASSYDATVFPPMHKFLHTLHAKGLRNRKVALIENGSWSPTAGRVMQQMLGEMKDIEVITPLLTLRAAMKAVDRESLKAMARKLLAR